MSLQDFSYNFLNSIFSSNYFLIQDTAIKKLWETGRIILTMFIFVCFLYCILYIPNSTHYDTGKKAVIIFPLFALIICFVIGFTQNLFNNKIFLSIFSIIFYIFITILFAIIIGSSQSVTTNKNKSYIETLNSTILLPLSPIFAGLYLYFTDSSKLLENNMLGYLGLLFIVFLIIYSIIINYTVRVENNKNDDTSFLNFSNSNKNSDYIHFLQYYAFTSFAIWISAILIILLVSPPYIEWYYTIGICVFIISIVFFIIRMTLSSNYYVGQLVEVFYSEMWRPRTVKSITYADDGTVRYIHVNANDDEDDPQNNIESRQFNPNQFRSVPNLAVSKSSK